MWSSKLYQKAKKTATKIKKKVCTTAKRIQKATVSFVKNVDWKKVVTGAAVAVAIAGGTAVMFNQAANAGSSVAGNYAVRQAVDVGTDTVLDTARAVARGEDVNAKTIGRDLLTNTLMAGAKAAGGNGKNGIAREGTGGTNNVAEVNLKYKEGWTSAQKAEADLKVKALSEADTVKTPVNRSGTSASSRYKSANGQTSVPKGYDIDHTIDLQLGGEDDILNMKPLDQSVNKSLGVQIKNAIKEYPNGTRFGEFNIK